MTSPQTMKGPMIRKQLPLAAALVAAALGAAKAQVIDFSDLSLAAESYTNNSSFNSGGAGFNNSFNATYSSWGGFAYSNTTNSTGPGYTNQYSSITGTSGNGTAGGIYAVAYQDFYTPTTPTIVLPLGYQEPVSIRLTNTTYAYFAIRDGDGFTLPFAEGDWFTVTIHGYSAANALLGSVEYFLADFRSAVPSEHTILNSWETVSLTPLGAGVSYLTLTFDSSDTGAFGINTPTYAAVGNLVLIPEPGTGVLVLAAAGLLFRGRRRT